MDDLHVLCFADSGAVFTGPDGRLVVSERPDEAAQIQGVIATTLPCRQVEVRIVRANAPTQVERRCYAAILEYNNPSEEEEPAEEEVAEPNWQVVLDRVG